MSGRVLALSLVLVHCAPYEHEPRPASRELVMKLDALWEMTRRNPFRPARLLGDGEYAGLERAAGELLLAARQSDRAEAERAAAALAPFGLSRVPCELENGEPVVAVVDLEGAGGGYVLRLGPIESEIVLQVPHRFFDIGTGPIGRRAFEAARMRALFFNTAHRYSTTGGVPTPAAATDMTRSTRSYLSAFTAAAAAVLDPAIVIQLHGFGEQEALEGVDAIVSPGASVSGSALRIVRSALEAVGGRVLTYPDEVGQLGGVENAQGQLLARTKSSFVHAELSMSFRQRLRDGRDAARLGELLAGAFAKERGSP